MNQVSGHPGLFDAKSTRGAPVETSNRRASPTLSAWPVVVPHLF
jgi:hypothetical protein